MDRNIRKNKNGDKKPFKKVVKKGVNKVGNTDPENEITKSKQLLKSIQNKRPKRRTMPRKTTSNNSGNKALLPGLDDLEKMYDTDYDEETNISKVHQAIANDSLPNSNLSLNEIDSKSSIAIVNNNHSPMEIINLDDSLENSTLSTPAINLSSLSENQRFSPLPSTSRDSNTFLENDIRLRKSSGTVVNNCDESQSDIEIVEDEIEIIVINDESMDVSSNDRIPDSSVILNPESPIVLDDCDTIEPNVVDNNYYCTREPEEKECDTMCIENLIAESRAFLERYSNHFSINTVTNVQPEPLNDNVLPPNRNENGIANNSSAPEHPEARNNSNTNENHIANSSATEERNNGNRIENHNASNSSALERPEARNNAIRNDNHIANNSSAPERPETRNNAIRNDNHIANNSSAPERPETRNNAIRNDNHIANNSSAPERPETRNNAIRNDNHIANNSSAPERPETRNNAIRNDNHIANNSSAPKRPETRNNAIRNDNHIANNSSAPERPETRNNATRNEDFTANNTSGPERPEARNNAARNEDRIANNRSAPERPEARNNANRNENRNANNNSASEGPELRNTANRSENRIANNSRAPGCPEARNNVTRNENRNANRRVRESTEARNNAAESNCQNPVTRTDIYFIRRLSDTLQRCIQNGIEIVCRQSRDCDCSACLAKRVNRHVLVLRRGQGRSEAAGWESIATPTPSTLSRICFPRRSNKGPKGDCPICMDPFSGQDIAATICGHVFCKTCLESAIRASGKKCPTCRRLLKGANAYHPLFM